MRRGGVRSAWSWPCVVRIRSVKQRPKCGRLARSGAPCAALVRYSRPLRQFAPACRQHMTDVEREAVDVDPLWSDEGQVLWFLEQRARTDELTPVSAVAAELGCQPPVVVFALRKLLERRAIAVHTVSGRKLWGTAAQVQRLGEARNQAAADAAERAENIDDRNRDLEAVRRQLVTSVAGRRIEVTSLSRLYPSGWNGAQIDQLMVVIDDPEAAAWLLGKLSRPD